MGETIDIDDYVVTVKLDEFSTPSYAPSTFSHFIEEHARGKNAKSAFINWVDDNKELIERSNLWHKADFYLVGNFGRTVFGPFNLIVNTKTVTEVTEIKVK